MHPFHYVGTDFWADATRVVFVFVPASIIFGSVAMVMIAYYRAYRAERYRSVRAGLLPHHVWLISVSYMLLLVDEILTVFERKSHGFSYHAALLIPAFISGVIAMHLVLKYEQKRHEFSSTVNKDLDDD